MIYIVTMIINIGLELQDNEEKCSGTVTIHFWQIFLGLMILNSLVSAIFEHQNIDMLPRDRVSRSQNILSLKEIMIWV